MTTVLTTYCSLHFTPCSPFPSHTRSFYSCFKCYYIITIFILSLSFPLSKPSQMMPHLLSSKTLASPFIDCYCVHIHTCIYTYSPKSNLLCLCNVVYMHVFRADLLVLVCSWKGMFMFRNRLTGFPC